MKLKELKGRIIEDLYGWVKETLADYIKSKRENQEDDINEDTEEKDTSGEEQR